ncbi:MAG: PEP-CTERM sorting domain-containing protein [Candidatus Acidiferrales bacterium]
MTKLYVAVAFLALTSAGAARADIVGGAVTGGTAQTAGGVFVALTTPLMNLFGTPDSVGNDNFQSPNLFAFNEAQNFTLTAPLVLDSGSIAAGTIVSSQYVFFDPGPGKRVIGTVDFGSDILAIITRTGTLVTSDFLGASGVNYVNTTNRGLEAGDSVTLNGPSEILVDVFASSPGDYVRVITAGTTATATVPEPSSIVLVGVGLGASLVGLTRRRRALNSHRVA